MDTSHYTNVAHSNKSLLSGLITLMRPKHWIKNAFVLTPLIFSAKIINFHQIGLALEAFFIFCVASSICYIINDIHDIPQDREHPEKLKTRPLASGLVKVPQALLLALLLYTILLAGFLYIPKVTLIAHFYLIVIFAYTYYLKQQPILDLFCIATGFVLRVYAGAVALLLPMSVWMFVTTFCLALYLAAIKRRQELLFNTDKTRDVLKHYSVSLVERYAEISATGAIIFYSLFVVTTRPELVITIPFVLFGLFRYWYIVETLDGGELPTEALYSDWQLSVSILLCFACSFYTILYPL